MGVRHRRLRSVILAGACASALGVASCEAPQTRSEIEGAKLVAETTLPRSPEAQSVASYCDNYPAKTLGPAGRQVASQGWIVTSEAALGGHQVVTFVSGFDPGTSGICFARNAHIGVFDAGGKLVALTSSSPSANGFLGTVEPLESGALLVWGGDGPGPPVGELHTKEGGFRLTEIAPERSFCGGRAVVPNVYGKPLDAARKALIAGGWQPLPPERAPEWGAAADLAKAGVIEVEDCSGTGVGYCGYNYRGAAGVLGVTTVGGEPEPAGNTVVSYDVRCAGSAKRPG